MSCRPSARARRFIIARKAAPAAARSPSRARARRRSPSRAAARTAALPAGTRSPLRKPFADERHARDGGPDLHDRLRAAAARGRAAPVMIFVSEAIGRRAWAWLAQSTLPVDALITIAALRGQRRRERVRERAARRAGDAAPLRAPLTLASAGAALGRSPRRRAARPHVGRPVSSHTEPSAATASRLAASTSGRRRERRRRRRRRTGCSTDVTGSGTGWLFASEALQAASTLLPLPRRQSGAAPRRLSEAAAR